MSELHGAHDDREARERRKQAIERAIERFPLVHARFEAAYGMRLPRHLAYGAAFFLGLSNRERALCPVSLFGMAAWFHWLGEEEQPVAALDERLEGRFRTDPPEFVTIASGDSDGSHWGLWYDLPSELPRLVAHGYARDDGAVWQVAPTLLGAIRGELSTEHLDDEDKRRVRALISWLDVLLERERAAHAEEKIGPPHRERIDLGSLGLGPYLPGLEFPTELADANARYEAYRAHAPVVSDWVARARAALREGDGRLALLLGRELHLLDDDATRDVSLELLTGGYEALDRPELAAIARVHHAHRDLRSVSIYRSRDMVEQEREPAPLVVAARNRELDEVERVLADKPPLDDVVEAMLTLDLVHVEDSAAILERLLRYGGSEAASRGFTHQLIRIGCAVGPDLLEKASRPGAESTRETVEFMLKKQDRRLVDLLLAHGARATSAFDCEMAVATGVLDIAEHALRTAPDGFDACAHRAHYTLVENPDRASGGATLLHLAVTTASPELVRVLVDRGVDPEVRDDAGQTARDLARLLWVLRPREANAMLDMLAKPRTPPPKQEGWEVGATAKHAKFGEGSVVAIAGTGEEAKLTVRFPTGEKTLLARFLTRG